VTARILVREIPWAWSPLGSPLGLPLGRHVEHDSRSRAYAHPIEHLTLRSVRHQRRIPILDQGDLGSCTGNAAAGALGTEPFAATLTPAQVSGIDEPFAVGVYSEATSLDDVPGAYPPDDTGSSGLAVAKVLKRHGWTAGYTHTFSLQDALLALTTTPVMVGMDWYDSFDEPDPSGLVRIASGAQVRGGHEIVADELDVDGQLVWFDNSWGAGWGAGGRFAMTWDTLGQLLDQDGDVTIPTPRTQPTPQPAATAADVQLLAAVRAWQATKSWP
jgi:hypothetical protein